MTSTLLDLAVLALLVRVWLRGPQAPRDSITGAAVAVCAVSMAIIYATALVLIVGRLL